MVNFLGLTYIVYKKKNGFSESLQTFKYEDTYFDFWSPVILDKAMGLFFCILLSFIHSILLICTLVLCVLAI